MSEIDSYVNAHTHLYSALVPLGMPAPNPPPTDFLEILKRIWWRLDRALDADSLRASARLYAAEAVKLGTYAVVDHHESPRFIEGSLDVVADACQEFGLRAVVCYGATERNDGPAEAKRGLKECRRFIDGNRRPLVRGVVGLHAGFTVSDETIRDAANLARDLDSVLHIHVAEDGVDVRDAHERGYEGIIDRFEKLDALIPGSVFAHGIHLSVEEVKRCAATGCWFVQNPRSNRGNGVGYPKALRHSDRVALGTDGYPADMLEEADALFAEAETAHDDLDRVRARLSAGHRLVTERFSGSSPEGPQDREAALAKVQKAIPGIRAAAKIQAGRVWTRMRAL